MKTLIKLTTIVILMSLPIQATVYDCVINDGNGKKRITKAEVYKGKVVMTYIQAKDVPPYVFRYDTVKGYICTKDKNLFLNLLSEKHEVPYLIEMYSPLNGGDEISEIHECNKR